MKMKILFSAVLACLCLVSFAQGDTSKVSIKLGADLVSRYIWRGASYGPGVHFQPALSVTTCGFTLGTWGSTNFNGNYGETDLYLSYNYKFLTLSVTDYFSTTETSNFQGYFDYNDLSTLHLVEGTVSFTGPEKFPLTLLAGVMVYGADKDPATGDNYYSTYIEAGYTKTIKETTLSLNCGITPMKSIYGSEFGVIHASIKGAKEIKISDQFSLPVSVTLVSNPQAENFFVVFGLSL
jgi:hypothetical protein